MAGLHPRGIRTNYGEDWHTEGWRGKPRKEEINLKIKKVAGGRKGEKSNKVGKVGIVLQSRSNHGKKGLLRFCLHCRLSSLLEQTYVLSFSSSFTILFFTLLYELKTFTYL